MNLNYTGLKAEDYSAEVLKKYAFPTTDEMQRYMRSEQQFGQEQHISSKKQALKDFLVVTGGISIGTLSYIYYNMSGKVIRDRIRASMPLPRKFLALGLPFFGLGLAFIVVRRGLENPHTYKQ